MPILLITVNTIKIQNKVNAKLGAWIKPSKINQKYNHIASANTFDNEIKVMFI